jgi:LysR family hca operon transcriptional activator
MELRHLRYFVAVAEELNVTRAARRLHTVQPSLSRQMRQLEEFLSCSLLTRDRNHLALTEAGHAMLAGARRVLSELEATVETTRQAASSEMGKVVVAFFPGADGKVFSRLAAYVHSHRPDMQIIMRSMTSTEQLAALRNRMISAGFLRGPVTDPQICAEVIRSDRIVVILPAEHRLARYRRITFAQLADVPWVGMRGAGVQQFQNMIRSFAAAQGVEFVTGLMTDNMLETLAAVGAGLGFSVLPDYVEQMLPRAACVRPLALNPQPTVDLFLAYRRDEKAIAIASFVQLVRECFANEA